MAGIIATEAQAAAIGGGSSYTSNLMVTRTRAVALGCSIRNSYENNQLVSHGDLYKPGYTYCTCNAQCTCDLVCTSVSGQTTCTCNSECSCKNYQTWCTCQNHCACNVKITEVSGSDISCTSIKANAACSSWCSENTGIYNGPLDCGIWCYTNWCTSNSATVHGYQGNKWCNGHCYTYNYCSCDIKCTCNTEVKQSSSTCACDAYCSCNSNGCTCQGYCTCNTVCGCNKNTCDCQSQCSCVGYCTCNSVS